MNSSATRIVLKSLLCRTGLVGRGGLLLTAILETCQYSCCCQHRQVSVLGLSVTAMVFCILVRREINKSFHRLIKQRKRRRIISQLQGQSPFSFLFGQSGAKQKVLNAARVNFTRLLHLLSLGDIQSRSKIHKSVCQMCQLGGNSKQGLFKSKKLFEGSSLQGTFKQGKRAIFKQWLVFHFILVDKTIDKSTLIGHSENNNIVLQWHVGTFFKLPSSSEVTANVIEKTSFF